MKRGFAVAVVALVSLAGGCASPARYIEKGADGGVVGVPAGTDGRASDAQRREAVALIQKHVGTKYEIVEEGPVRPAGATGAVGGGVETAEWRIAYRKAPEGASTDGMPQGLVPNLGPNVPPRVNGSTRTIGGGAGQHMMTLGGAPRHADGFPLGAGAAPGGR
jgi:hypothetical protein